MSASVSRTAPARAVSASADIDPESRPRARGAVDADGPAVLLDDGAAEVEAEAEAAGPLAGGAPHEAIEDPRPLVAGEPGPGIAHLDPRCGRRLGQQADGDVRAGRRVADGVLQQVDEHLLHPPDVDGGAERRGR